jgi:small subunit ribosomal protein S8
LKEEGYLVSIKRTADKRKILLLLKYHDKKPAITTIKRISKPGCRIYCPAKKIFPVLGGLGISIISTSQGLLANTQARKKNLGGEIICEVF